MTWQYGRQCHERLLLQLQLGRAGRACSRLDPAKLPVIVGSFNTNSRVLGFNSARLDLLVQDTLCYTFQAAPVFTPCFVSSDQKGHQEPGEDIIWLSSIDFQELCSITTA